MRETDNRYIHDSFYVKDFGTKHARGWLSARRGCEVDGDIWTKNNEKSHGKMLHREQILSAKACRYVKVGLFQRLPAERQTGVSGNRETDRCVWKQRDRPVCLETERRPVCLETERRPVCLESKEQVEGGKSQRLRLAQCCMWQCWGGSEASEGATRRF